MIILVVIGVFFVYHGAGCILGIFVQCCYFAETRDAFACINAVFAAFFGVALIIMGKKLVRMSVSQPPNEDEVEEAEEDPG